MFFALETFPTMITLPPFVRLAQLVLHYGKFQGQNGKKNKFQILLAYLVEQKKVMMMMTTMK